MVTINTEDDLEAYMREYFTDVHVDLLRQYIDRKILKDFDAIQHGNGFPDGSKEKRNTENYITRIGGIKDFHLYLTQLLEEENDAE